MVQTEDDIYHDAVAYIIQYAQYCATSDIMAKFCLDIIQKARFMYNLNPQAFEGRRTDKILQIHEKKYSEDPKYNRLNNDINNGDCDMSDKEEAELINELRNK